MNNVKMLFEIVDGPRHPFDLAICLIEPTIHPDILDNSEPGGIRHPGFKVNVVGLWDKRKYTKEQKFVVSVVSNYNGDVPVGIDSLTRSPITYGLWYFTGNIRYPGGPVGNRLRSVANGYYSLTTHTGEITISTPSE